jgi:tetratricopeptide (TPR) repeat protein
MEAVMAKESKKKQQQKLKLRQKLMQRKSPSGLEAIADLLDGGRYEDAVTLLHEQLRKFPRNAPLLRMLQTAYRHLENYAGSVAVCERLLEIAPRDHGLWLDLAAAQLQAMMSASATQSFRHLIALWPNDPMVEGARKTIEQLIRVVDNEQTYAPLPAAERMALVTLHERAILARDLREYDKSIALAEELLARYADFTPARNNLSKACFFAGRFSDALAASRQVLAQDANNVQALGDLIHHLYLSGDAQAARETLDRMVETPGRKIADWLQLGTSLSLMGSDRVIIALYDEAERKGILRSDNPALATFYHHCAAAHARIGKEIVARQLWEKALDLCPLPIAEDNLDDLDLPAAERNGPWAFDFMDLVPRPLLDRLCQVMGSKDEDGRRLVEVLHKNPQLIALAPMLLEPGDDRGREFAFHAATALDTEESRAWLRTFALGQNGTDALRLQAATWLAEKGVIQPGPCPMWLDGEWTTQELIEYRISFEARPSKLSSWGKQASKEGFEALQSGYDERAREIFEKILAKEGESASLLHNLATAYQAVGEEAKARALFDRIYATWPEYFYGIVGRANDAMDKGALEEAEALLAPLRSQRDLHVSELAALCIVHARLFETRRDFEAAKSWLRIWRHFDPMNPQLPHAEANLKRQMSKGWIVEGAKRLLGR